MNIETNPNSFQAVCLTHLGKRANHEDNFVFGSQCLESSIQINMKKNGLIYLTGNFDSNELQIFAVSDGMGGHNGGETASYICVQDLISFYSILQSLKDYSQIPTLFQKEINKINTKICELSKKNSNLNNMGATLVALLRFKEEFMFFNLGDSRAYFYENNELIQLTTDHTEGRRLLDAGLISLDKIKDFKNKKSLYRYLGLNKTGLKIKAEENFFKIKQGIVILCSDGISDFVSDEVIKQILYTNQELLNAGKKIITEAIKKESADNATLILIKI